MDKYQLGEKWKDINKEEVRPELMIKNEGQIKERADMRTGETGK